MSPFLFVVLYFFICGLYLTRMRHSPEKGNRVIFKLIPIGLLLGATITCLAKRNVLIIKNLQFVPRIYTLGGGLLFQCMTAVYEEFTSLAVYSTVSYNVALGIYVYGFSTSFNLFKEFEVYDVSIMVGLLILSAVVLLYLLPKLHAFKALLLGIQLSLESLFLTIQIVLIYKGTLPNIYLGVLGTFAMYLADIIMSIGLYRKPFPYFKSLSIGLNYTGILMLTGSVILVVL